MNAANFPLPSSTFTVNAAKEKSLEKKFKRGRFKCKNLKCPLYLKCHSADPIKTHWKKEHGVVSNNDDDFCKHCGNYKDHPDPCNFLDPCPLARKESKDDVKKRLEELYYKEKEEREAAWKEKNEAAKKEKAAKKEEEEK